MEKPRGPSAPAAAGVTAFCGLRAESGDSECKQERAPGLWKNGEETMKAAKTEREVLKRLGDAYEKEHERGK